MRGLPFLRLILTVLAFAAMALPVWRLTRPALAGDPVAPPEGPAAAATALPVTLEVQVTFAGPLPLGFQLKEQGRVVLEGSGQESTPGQWQARLPKEGVDLIFEAHFPPGSAQAAAQITLNFPDGFQIEKSFWGHGALREVITVPQRPGGPPPN